MNKEEIEIPNTTITRDTREISEPTDNLYEAVAVISKRANQIASATKEELVAKLDEFASEHDNLEEIFENREQIEISKYYESLPKATIVAIEEFLANKVYHRNPAKEESK
ncbi:DNA-directed RNA polymerase subunit omega [Bacteroidia bacterium]|jgi:DNA-directed RNA polymerase subunit K/omega|nr:DNA-directed RNA polymerase subunit omega [Bacteroidota bacterium]MDB4174504.1 DNA-directed RNA polymerase subunit omega [Bacteroidia bacterium]